MKRTLILTGEAARKAACREVLAAPDGFAVTIGERTRTLDQNAKLWPMLHDVAQKVVPGLDGGFVVCGQSTSKMGKREFADLIELIYAFGAERGVAWSEPHQRMAA